MKGNSLVIKRKVMGFTIGLMVEHFKDGGISANNMESGNTKKTVMKAYNMEYGKWVNG